jgi:chromosome segregation ATPase
VEVTSLAERLTALREKIGGLEGDIADAREDQDVKAAESEELKEDIEVQAARVLESEERIAELTRRAEEQERSISLHSHDLETLEVEMRRMSARIQELSRDRNEQDNEAREQELRLAEVRAQSDYIEREAQEKFGLGIAQVREELEARCRADRIESASGFRIEESEEAGEEAASRKRRQRNADGRRGFGWRGNGSRERECRSEIRRGFEKLGVGRRFVRSRSIAATARGSARQTRAPWAM